MWLVATTLTSTLSAPPLPQTSATFPRQGTGGIYHNLDTNISLYFEAQVTVWPVDKQKDTRGSRAFFV